MDKAIVIRPVFEPGRRIIAVSDIHGNLPFFLALMDKIGLTPDDNLVLLGDMLEKGRDSLPNFPRRLTPVPGSERSRAVGRSPHEACKYTKLSHAPLAS